MLKTISRNEFKKLKSILKAYYEHIFHNPDSLITRFFGLHKVQFRRKTNLKVEKNYLVIMNNVFRDLNVGDRFDLKGST